jgi:lipoate-protein ligase A
MRIKGGVLQHGAIPLTGDIGHIGELLASRPDPERIRTRATTLREVLGRTVEWEEMAAALVAGFARLLNVALRAGTLQPQERTEAERLEETKYATERWTARV